MRVLSILHGRDGRAELFFDVVAGLGHSLEEWRFARGTPPPGGFDAVLVLGGSMHADEDGRHPWLGEELRWLRDLVGSGVPTLGICLGVQLLARAGGAWVGPLPEPEIGWVEVELTKAGAADPVLSALPPSFEAFQWHHYTYDVPAGGVELARSTACTQAFRLGQACWGVQFHPEVTGPQIERWIDDGDGPPPDPEWMRAGIATKIGRWNDLGRTLCTAFLEAAQGVPASAS